MPYVIGWRALETYSAAWGSAEARPQCAVQLPVAPQAVIVLPDQRIGHVQHARHRAQAVRARGGRPLGAVGDSATCRGQNPRRLGS